MTPAGRDALARDLLAALFVLGGIGATSWGAALIAPAAGWIVLGVLMLAVGVALGYGETGGVGGIEEVAGAGEEGESGLVEPIAAEVGKGGSRYVEGAPVQDQVTTQPGSASPTPPTSVPASVSPPPSRPAAVSVQVPAGSYVGIRDQRDTADKNGTVPR